MQAVPLNLVFGADHAGVEMKTTLMAYAQTLGHKTLDIGTDRSDISVDYPDIVLKVTQVLRTNQAQLGILICGSGVGVAMAANRHKGIRAAPCHCGLIAEYARRHNNANVLCLGARFIGPVVAQDCLERFLNTSFEGGERHERRLQKLDQ